MLALDSVCLLNAYVAIHSVSPSWLFAFIDFIFVFLVQIFRAPTCAIWKVVLMPLQWQHCGELSCKNLAKCGKNLGVKIVCLPPHSEPECVQKFNDY